MKAYKLTDANNKTKNNTQWGENISHTATGKDDYLCSDGWIHFYTNELIAVLLNSVHANFPNPHLWEGETEGEHCHEPLKSGCKTLTTIKQIPLPEISVTQKVAFGILCGKEVCHDEQWNKWADNWLNNIDRSPETAADVAYAVIWSAVARAAADAWFAAAAARVAAADARVAAYYTTRTAADAAAARAAAAAHAAYYAARAAWSAAGASAAGKKIDFIVIAQKAMSY